MTQSRKGEKSKEHLIECAAQLFIQNGYNATGINDILSHAELSKGSFYFYFASKKELALAVADYYSQRISTRVLRAAEERDWTDFVSRLVGEMIQNAEMSQGFGCPLAVMGMELAFLEPEVSAKYYDSMKLTGIFAEVLKRSGMPEEKVLLIAERAFVIYEGHLLLYRMNKDVNQLQKLLRDLKAIHSFM